MTNQEKIDRFLEKNQQRVEELKAKLQIINKENINETNQESKSAFSECNEELEWETIDEQENPENGRKLETHEIRKLVQNVLKNWKVR